MSEHTANKHSDCNSQPDSFSRNNSTKQNIFCCSADHHHLHLQLHGDSELKVRRFSLYLLKVPAYLLFLFLLLYYTIITSSITSSSSSSTSPTSSSTSPASSLPLPLTPSSPSLLPVHLLYLLFVFLLLLCSPPLQVVLLSVPPHLDH